MMSERSVNNTNKKPKIMFYKAEIGVYRWELFAPVALYSHFYSWRCLFEITGSFYKQA